MANLAGAIWRDPHGVVMLCVENALPPSDAEWRGYCRDVAVALESPTATAIAITDGGGPDATQRTVLNDLLAGRNVPCAVISDSLFVRGVVTALSWFNKEISVFSPSAVQQGLLFTNLNGERARAVWELIRRLNQQIDPPCSTIAEAEPFLKF